MKNYVIMADYSILSVWNKNKFDPISIIILGILLEYKGVI